jgi:hypothetical protein
MNGIGSLFGIDVGRNRGQHPGPHLRNAPDPCSGVWRPVVSGGKVTLPFTKRKYVVAGKGGVVVENERGERYRTYGGFVRADRVVRG